MLRAEGFKRDARVLVEIPDDLFETANLALERATGPLGPSRAHEVLRALLTTEQSNAIVNFTSNFGGLHREFPGYDVPREVELRSAKVFADSPEMPGQLRARLERLLVPKPGIELQAKVDRVSEKTGRRLEELSLVCDLRPVFDDSRSKVEALLPITVMKLVVRADDGSKTVEAQLSEKELLDLEVEVARAKSKLSVLKSLVHATGVALPESDLLTSKVES